MARYISNKALILLSGGLDSTTCLSIAKKECFDCYALSFDYGQRHKAELDAAKKIAKLYGVKDHNIVKVPTWDKSALTDTKLDIQKYTGKDEIPNTYVPARNIIFLSIALGISETLGISDIFIGVNSVEYSGYPDCRPEFIEAFEKAANLGTKKGTQESLFKIHTPLINLSKAEIIKKGLALGVDYGITVSCYQLDSMGRACGYCDSCVLRKKGFENLNVPDPTNYV